MNSSLQVGLINKNVQPIFLHDIKILFNHVPVGHSYNFIESSCSLVFKITNTGFFVPDEDSETEDYQKEAHRINPIIGNIFSQYMAT